MRTNRTFGVLGIFAVSVGVVCPLMGASTPAMAGPPGTPAPVSVVLNFNPAFGQLPESITADGNGNIYASNVSGAVQKIDPVTQSFTTVATVTLPAGASLTGIKVGPDGFIYVCSDSFSPTPAGAFVWKVSPQTGAVSLFATLNPNGFPNDIAFQDDGSMLVTDPFLALIYKIDTSGNATSGSPTRCSRATRRRPRSASTTSASTASPSTATRRTCSSATSTSAG